MFINRRGFLLSPIATASLAQAAQRVVPAQRLSPNSDPVNLREFGAKLDGITDDSVALQLAINECLVAGHARPLLVQGPCRLEKSIFIDRLVDRTRGVFRIIGEGSYGGFLAAGNFPLFNSRLTDSSVPRSENIWFQDIRFEALPTAPQASVLTDNFLRIQFQDCEFQRIKALSGRKYAQEWQFSRCIAQRWEGSFFSCGGGYHITSTASKYQNGNGNVFEIKDPTLKNAGCVGCAFHQDSVEANTGSFLKAAVARGLSIAGLYSEGNYGPTIDLDTAGLNQGVSITGSMFAPQVDNRANPDFFDIRWGRIDGGHAGGNFSNGRLHHHRSESPLGLNILADYALLKLVEHVI